MDIETMLEAMQIAIYQSVGVSPRRNRHHRKLQAEKIADGIIHRYRRLQGENGILRAGVAFINERQADDSCWNLSDVTGPIPAFINKKQADDD